MIVRITVDPNQPVMLQDADDFGRFHLEVVGLDLPQLRAAVENHRLGRMFADDHVDVSITALTALAGERDADWHANLDSMLAYARSKGWMPDADHVRAHCEWVG